MIEPVALLRSLFALLVVLVGLTFAPLARAQDSKSILDAARFTELVQLGDKRRAAGNITDAARAYLEALDIQPDPVVGGRVGLILLGANRPAEAARYLLRAIVEGEPSPREGEAFHNGFSKARPRICYVDVFVSEVDADVDIDGKPEASAEGRFSVFVSPGRHTFRASLKGFDDAVETIEATAGGSRVVRLVLKLLPNPPPPEAPKPSPPPAAAVELPREPAPEAPPCPVCPRPVATPQPLERWGAGGGMVLVLGAPSSEPLIGLAASGTVRLTEVWSAQLDLRVVFSPNKLGNLPVRAVNEGASAGLCVSYRRAFLCPFGFYAGLVHYKPEWGPWRAPIPLYGPAIKVGIDLGLGDSSALRIVGEFVVPVYPAEYTLGPADAKWAAWTGVQAMGTLGALVVRKF